MKTAPSAGSSALRSAVLAAAGIAAAAPAARAQYTMTRYPNGSGAREVLEWEGRVDREIQLVLRDGRVDVRRLGAREPRGGSARVLGALPRRDGYLRVERLEGRGNVDVVEQPSASNGYTAVLRLLDPASGAGSYRIAAYWVPTGISDGRYGRDDRSSSGRNDGRYDRGRRGDDRDDRYDGRNDGRRDDRWGRGRGGYGSNTGVMRWSGDVDGRVRIQWRDTRTATTTVAGQSPRNVSSRVSGAGLPTTGDAQLDVRVRDGRGAVTVVQQPSARNGYTGVILVNDPAGGFGHYDFDVTWK